MGAVPTLLLLIAGGITYGWQPDREGGVEYIIQVAPDQIEKLQQTGEISSVIDPQVRGHVSRVILRVGTGPLPQETPANLADVSTANRARSTAALTAMDASPVPIPEMIDSAFVGPIPATTGWSSSEQSVLKPDTSSPPNSPFSFPAPPPTLQTTGTQFDRAGREIPPSNQIPAASIGAPTAAAAGGPGRVAPGRVAPPGTRAPAPFTAATPPPFTGNLTAADVARIRAGGPTTEPIANRDITWQDFPLQTAPAANAAPTTQGTAVSTTANGANTGFPSSSSTALAPGDTYGRMPGGFSFAANTPASSPVNSSPATSSNAYSTGPDPRLTPALVAAGGWSIDNSGQVLDRQGRPLNSSFGGSGNYAQATSQGAVQGTNQVPMAGNAVNSGQFGNTSTSSSGLGFPAATNTGSLFERSPFANDSAAFPTQPITHQTPIDHRGQAHDLESPRARTITEADSIHRAPLRRGADVGSREASFEESASDRHVDSTSVSDRRTVPETTSSDGRREVVAPQPLFNGLLMISLVANVYLIFWLKNLRIQFRDLVAAKRMASTNSP